MSERRPEQLPLQPTFEDGKGVHRFVANELVRWMLDEGTKAKVFDLNRLCTLGYPDDHLEQLLQLIGYSVGGYEANPLVTAEGWERVRQALGESA